MTPPETKKDDEQAEKDAAAVASLYSQGEDTWEEAVVQGVIAGK